MERYIIPEHDITCKEAKEIIKSSTTTMEVVEYSYTLGYNRGKQNGRVPVLGLKMMSDERWQELAKASQNERQAVFCGK